MITDTFYDALMIMGLGMAGIFVFMLLFWGIITALHRMFPVKKEQNEEKS